jgi:ATP-binding cassette subfamily B multidrug efflux pump
VSASTASFFDWKLLRRVMGYAAPYKNRFWISVILAIVLAALTPLRPLLIQRTVNEYIVGEIPRMVILVTMIQLGIILVETALRFGFTFLTAWLGQAVVMDLRLATYDKILRLHLSQFDRTPVGTLTTRTVNDIESINDIFAEGLVPIIADILSIVCVLTYMFSADWRLTLIALIPFPIILIATYIFKESINRSFQSVRNAVASLNAFVQEHLTGMFIVQAFAAEQLELDKFKKINRQHRDANIKAIFAYSVFFPVVEIVLALSIGLVVWYTAKEALALQQSQQGTVIAFILCLNLLFRPLRVLADKFNVLQMGVIASERVFNVLDNPEAVPPFTNKPLENLRFSGKIEFENVHFAYDPAVPVLKGISFVAHPGETIALVGPTGSGKTSITSLLTRLYDFQSGQIKIDNLPIQSYELETLRGQVGVVLQDVFLFSGSIYDNITLRNASISRDRVEEAARMIGLHDFICSLPGGYDYDVRERGLTLSLGQRQLLSFIRALLYNPSILILDEATSSIDSESEQLIQQAIEKLVQGRTSIVVAHRLSTIRKATRIIVLGKGEILEMGTHADLIAKNGHYAQLCRAQFPESIGP